MDDPKLVRGVASSISQVPLAALREAITEQLIGKRSIAPADAAIMQDALEASLRANEMNRQLASPPDGIFATDANGNTTFINAAAAKMTGWTADELLGKPHHIFVDDVASGLSPSLPASDQDVIFRCKDNSCFPATSTGTSILRHGRLLGNVVVFRDISETRRKERWEQSKNEIVSAIIGHLSLSLTMQLMADALVALYPENSIAIFLLAGDEYSIVAEAGLPERATGRTADPSAALAERRAEGPISGSGNRPGSHRAAAKYPDLGGILQSGRQLCVALPLLSGAGEERGLITVFDSHHGHLDDNQRATIQSLCDMARLAIEHRQIYDQLTHRAQFDPLTGLPNRILLEDRMRQAMNMARRQGTLIAVCCIDLDRFHQINDTLGHDLGDVCFKAVSDKLQLLIREMDALARNDGDAFILSLSNIAQPADALIICQRLLRDLSVPAQVGGHLVTVTASIGISIFPEHGDTPDLLFRNADMALQQAQRAGTSQAQIYSPTSARQCRRVAEMTDALGDALALRQFRMVYQPIYNMNREIVALEALLRWKHPKWGQVSPVEFIPIAESTGLIVSIGDWVIEEVCRQAMEWQDAAVPAVKMLANVSGVQLGRANFSSKIAETLERSGLSPARLELEITESWIISDLKGAAGKLQKLRKLGIGIAIDDFGTGHSTFSYLHELPLDTLKIDRSFIHRLDGSAANLSTVRAIKVLAQQLGLKTVAEGVETDEQLRQLAEIGCELVQGYFLARPLVPQAACSLLRKQQARLSFGDVPALAGAPTAG
jgi:diguanylate cyclase (GGDEF)-like protein/PAS domain S-box-containing protein